MAGSQSHGGQFENVRVKISRVERLESAYRYLATPEECQRNDHAWILLHQVTAATDTSSPSLPLLFGKR